MTTIHNHLLPLTQWTVEDSNVLAKLKLKREKTIPTPTEIRQNLGPRLADAVFSNLCVTTKKIVGLGKELDGPGVELWSQPKRQLLGEIILEQFPSRRHRQALTHQAILDYGEKCMAEWENKVAAERDLEIQEKIKEVVKEMNEQMETRINQIRTKEREDFLVRIAMMEERLEKRHQREMEALERKLTEEKDNKIAEVMETMNASHAHETELLLDASKTLLTNRFHFKINWIRADLEEDYTTKINSEIKMIKKKFKEEMRVQGGNTDLEAVKNQMLQSVVCTACLTADFLLNEFHQKVETLKKEINDLNECNACLADEIRRLEENNELCSTQVRSWECVVKDIVTQFQKFIEFNLKLPQGGASYLISWDKVLQLKNAIYDKMINKKRTGTIQVPESLDIHKSLSVKPEEASTISSSGICENIDMISIISSIIRRVIPSLPDLAEAEAEVSKILESILKKVIPSSSLLVEEPKDESSSIPKLNIDYRLCPKFQRSQQERKESSAELSPAHSNVLRSSCFDKQKTPQSLDEQLQNRITEITKIMDEHPNILKFIQAP